MLRHFKPSRFVLLTLIAVSVSSCATTPSVPVVANCPQFPEPPPSLMKPASSSNAVSDLELILSHWLVGAKKMPPP